MMLVQLFDRGKGKGSGPVQYTILENVPAFDENGRRIKGETKKRIPPPAVLRSDPDIVERLIDSSPNEWKYSSGVVAFGDTDTPTEQEQKEVMDDFERTFFAGLQPDQYSCLWVRHTHEGNVELHFVIPRLELSRMKALNAFPPGYQTMSDAWRDKWNHMKGWERPNDPARLRLVKRPDYELKLGQSDDLRGEITDWLTNRIVNGQIENRVDLIASLAEIGEVTRQGRDYVSVKPTGFTKAIRLKGAVYGEDFQRERFISEAEREDTRGLEPAARIDLERAREAAQRLKSHIDARIEYNTRRYSREPEKSAWRHGDVDSTGSADGRKDGGRSPDETDQLGQRDLHGGEQEYQGSSHSDTKESGQLSRVNAENDGGSGTISKEQQEELASRAGYNLRSLDDWLRWELGPDAIPSGPHPIQSNDNQRAERNDRPSVKPDTRSPNREHQIGNVSDTPKRRPKWLHNWRDACDQVTSKLKDGYERVRAAVIASIDAVERAIQRGYDAARVAEQSLERSSLELVTASAKFESSNQPVRAILEKLDRCFDRLGADEIADALQRGLTTFESSDVADGQDRKKRIARDIW